MPPGAAAVVTNGRILVVSDPASGFADPLSAGDFALLDTFAQTSQQASQVCHRSMLAWLMT